MIRIGGLASFRQNEHVNSGLNHLVRCKGDKEMVLSGNCVINY